MSLQIATGFAGALGTETQSDFAIRQVYGAVTRVHPKRSPFLALLSQTMKSGKATAKTVEFMTKAEFTPYFEIAADASAAATSFTVTSNLATTGDMVAICIRTGEQVLVRTRTSATALADITRSIGTAPAAAVVVGDRFLILQTARAEGAATPLSAIGISPRLWENYVQECEIDDAHTTLQKLQAQYNGDAIEQTKLDAAFEFMRRTNAALHFNPKVRYAAGSTEGGTYGRSIFGGAMNFSEELNDINVIDGVGAFTYDVLGTLMRDMARFSSNGHFYAFCDAEIHNIISNWQLPYARLELGADNEFGFSITRVRGGGWDIDFVEDYCFAELGMQDRCHIYSLDDMRLLTGSGLEETYNEEITGPAKDGSRLIQNQRNAAYTFLCNPYTVGKLSGITS